jgi:DNA-binding MarR family transcriptional regulator
MNRQPRDQDAQAGPSPEPALDPDLAAHVRLALAAWPQIDPEVEAIVTGIARACRCLDSSARATLARFGLTKEEYKVICALRDGTRSHGSICDDLGVSTGAMTNRLDKLERCGLLRRRADPSDRRGVLLELTDDGRSTLDRYVFAGSERERDLLGGLTAGDKQHLARLLQKLLVSLADAFETGTVSE